ncbi:MAG: hypothetical protein KIT16_17220, partial [Rhodospirillaceae bacterium]|nr:hypothetical protein [Rhodospirillaceae bacterium]
SRVSGVRLAVGLGVSAVAVWLLGPVVKNAGFTALLLIMAVLAACTVAFVLMLPGDAKTRAAMMPAPAE